MVVGIYNCQLQGSHQECKSQPLDVAAVEEFKVLIMWAEEVPQRVEELKKVLRLNQNYQEARDHALQAVGKDCRLRYWTNANISHAGALFPASLGSVDCDHPAGVPLHFLESKGSHSTSCPAHPPALSPPGNATPV